DGICTATRATSSDSGTSMTLYPFPRSAVDSRSASAEGSLTKMVAGPSTGCSRDSRSGGSALTRSSHTSVEGTWFPQKPLSVVPRRLPRTNSAPGRTAPVEVSTHRFAPTGQLGRRCDQEEDENDDPELARREARHERHVSRRAAGVKSRPDACRRHPWPP